MSRADLLRSDGGVRRDLGLLMVFAAVAVMLGAQDAPTRATFKVDSVRANTSAFQTVGVNGAPEAWAEGDEVAMMKALVGLGVSVAAAASSLWRTSAQR